MRTQNIIHNFYKTMQEYFPRLILNIRDIQERKKRYAIVVLNRPISLDKELIINLWNHCETKLKLI